MNQPLSPDEVLLNLISYFTRFDDQKLEMVLVRENVLDYCPEIFGQKRSYINNNPPGGFFPEG